MAADWEKMRTKNMKTRQMPLESRTGLLCRVAKSRATAKAQKGPHKALLITGSGLKGRGEKNGVKLKGPAASAQWGIPET